MDRCPEICAAHLTDAAEAVALTSCAEERHSVLLFWLSGLDGGLLWLCLTSVELNLTCILFDLELNLT